MKMKKILLFLGSILFLFLVTILTVPFFVDVDHYRPTIVSEANKNLNGTLELGKLKLSLWGAVNIRAESIKIHVNGFPKPLLNTDRFALEIPYSSLLSGRPQIIAVFDAPRIDLEKNAQSELNVLKLVKTNIAEPASSAIPSAPASPTNQTSAPAKMPAMLLGASLGISIKAGELQYKDAIAKANYAIKGLDLEAHHLGFAGTMNLKFTAPVQGNTPALNFSGAISGVAEITPLLANNAIRSAKGNILLDATKLSIEMTSGAFHKTNSMPLELKASFDGNEKDFILKNLELKFDEYKVYGKGLVQTVPSLHAKFNINTDPLHLERISAFVPMVAQYGLKGIATTNLNLETNGISHTLNGDLKLSDGEFMMKGLLKAPLQFSLQAGFTENTLNLMHASLQAPDSELQVQGNISNFLAPKFAISVNGKSFNVDKTIILPEPKKSASLFLPEAVAAESVENPFVVLAANPIIAKASGTLNAQIGRITAYNANMESITLHAQLINLLLHIQEASLKTFGGLIKASGEFELKAPTLPYKTQGNVSGISAQEAFANYFPKYKNTLEGKLNANWNLTGQLYPQSLLLRTLKGNAKILAQDGAIRSIDFQSTINAMMQKVPFLKDKKNIDIDNGFKTMSAELKFANGTINADPIQIAARGKGFDIKGKSRIEESLEQESFFDIYDPQGQLPKEISRGASAPTLALRFTGPVSSPKADYGYTTQRLASSAVKNNAKSILQNLGKSILNKGGNNEGNPAPAPAKAIGDALKKFGF